MAQLYKEKLREHKEAYLQLKHEFDLMVAENSRLHQVQANSQAVLQALQESLDTTKSDLLCIFDAVQSVDAVKEVAVVERCLSNM